MSAVRDDTRELRQMLLTSAHPIRTKITEDAPAGDEIEVLLLEHGLVFNADGLAVPSEETG